MTPKKLYFPVVLLTLTVIGPLVKITGASPADAEPVVKAAAVAPQPEIIPVTPPEVMPAPAVRPAAPRMAFAHGVPGLSPRVFTMALQAVSDARARGFSGREDLLTVIDYSLPSTEPRLWVLDLARGKVLYYELVAHGSGSGEKYATRFSNENRSAERRVGKE